MYVLGPPIFISDAVCEEELLVI